MDKKKELVSEILRGLPKEVGRVYVDQMVDVPAGNLLVDIETLDGGYIAGECQLSVVVMDDDYCLGDTLFSCKDREVFAGKVASYLLRHQKKLAAEAARLRALSERRVAELEAEESSPPMEEWERDELFDDAAEEED